MTPNLSLALAGEGTTSPADAHAAALRRHAAAHPQPVATHPSVVRPHWGSVRARRALTALAAGSLLLGAAGLASAAPAHAAEQTAGLYVLPFEPGTKVKVTRDHVNHTPPTRIDMVGKSSGGKVRITAPAAGKVRFIEDDFSEKRPGGKPCNNNYIWVESKETEAGKPLLYKISHLEKDSVTGDAGLSVGDAVKPGTFLGIQGDVGCASGEHTHLEKGVPKDPADPIDSQGFLRGGSARNRIPRFCGVSNQTLVAGKTYTASSLVPGAAEYARHGVTQPKYSQVFHEAVDCGYRLAWIDGYTHGGKLKFNVVFRTNSDHRAWRSHSRMTGSQYQDRYDAYEDEGFRLIHVDSYVVSGKVRYAAIWEKTPGPSLVAYHGLTASQHQTRLDELKAQGFVPRVISPVSLNGSRRYSAIYLKTNADAWEARSFLTQAQYQVKFDANKKAGRRLVYLNAYAHRGQPRISAIWWKSPAASVFAKHGLTSSQYQAEWAANTSAGRLTQAVTGYEQGGGARFAAFWAK